MKTKSVKSRLGKFKSISVGSGLCYCNRQTSNNQKRFIDVIDQNGNAICFPYVLENGIKRIVYHPNTIKGLVEFLEGK